MSRVRWRGLISSLPVAGVLALTGFGCHEERTSCPTVGNGAIQGYVLGGGRSVQALVWAESCVPDPLVRANTHTDSTGRYELPLPRGEYFLSVQVDTLNATLSYSHAGPVAPSFRGDTIHVEDTPVRIDLVGGALELRLRSPSELEDKPVQCEIRSLRSSFRAQLRKRPSGGSAAYRFSLLPPDEYTLALRLPYGILYWLPSGDLTSVERISVTSGATTSRSARLPTPAHILGEVRGSWQTLGAEAPAITAYDPDHIQIGRATVDGAGGFSLAVFHPGPARLLVQTAGIPLWVGGHDFETAMVFEVDTAETITGVSVVESGILCRLETEILGAIESFRISLRDARGTSLLETFAFSNPIPLPGLHTGSHFLEIRPAEPRQTWLAQWYDQQDSLSEATPIVVSTEGEVVPVTVHLLEGGRISGRVLDHDGTPVENPQIYAGPAADSTQVAYVDMGAASYGPGGFTVLRLRTGDYKVGVLVRSPSRISWYPGTTAWDSAGAIPVVQGSEVQGIEWRMPE